MTQSLEILQAKAKWWLKACDSLAWSSARVHVVVIIKILPAVRAILIQTWSTLPVPRITATRRKKKAGSQTIFGSINARMIKGHGQAPESTDKHPFVRLQSIRIEMMDPKKPVSPRPPPSALPSLFDQIGPNERFTVDGDQIKRLELDENDEGSLDGSHPRAEVLAADHYRPRVDNPVATAASPVQNQRRATNEADSPPMLTPPSRTAEAPSLDIVDAKKPAVTKTVTGNRFFVTGGSDLNLDIDDLLGRERNSREPAVKITKAQLKTLAEVIWLGMAETTEEVD